MVNDISDNEYEFFNLSMKLKHYQNIQNTEPKY